VLQNFLQALLLWNLGELTKIVIIYCFNYGMCRLGWNVAFRSAKVAWIYRCFRGAKGDGKLFAKETSLTLRRIIVSKKAVAEKLVQTKLALAAKCDRLIKTCNSRPKQKTLKNQAEKFRRQAKQLSQT
jgi:hypothetical protein